MCPKLGFRGHHGVITVYLFTLLSHYSRVMFQYQLYNKVNIRLCIVKIKYIQCRKS